MKWISKFEVKKEIFLDEICNEYYKLAFWQKEYDRILFAQKLLNNRKSNSLIPTLGVIDLHDYWYFVQLFSRWKHIYQDWTICKLNFSWEWVVFLEDFNDNDITDWWLFQVMLDIYDKKWLKFKWNKSVDSRFLSRENSDLLLEHTSVETLEYLWLDSSVYEIKHIPVDIYLRLYDKWLFWNSNIYTHVDWYRLRDDDEISTLFMWHKKYWWPSYIDWFWLRNSFPRLISRYIILPKTYLNW